jgi:hypothetical protein
VAFYTRRIASSRVRTWSFNGIAEHVMVDCALREEQPLRNLTIREVLRHQIKDFELASSGGARAHALAVRREDVLSLGHAVSSPMVGRVVRWRRRARVRVGCR